MNETNNIVVLEWTSGTEIEQLQEVMEAQILENLSINKDYNWEF